MPARWPISDTEVSHRVRWPTASLSVSCAETSEAADAIRTAAEQPSTVSFFMSSSRSCILMHFGYIDSSCRCALPRPREGDMHDTDFLHEHSELTEADRAEIARYIWSQETVELATVGIDIGSSTSHL